MRSLPQNTVQVHVRNAWDSHSSYLGPFAVDQLDELVSSISRWGTDQDEDSVTGQFAIYEDGDAGFEIVLHQAE